MTICMKFNVEKWILYLGWCNPGWTSGLGDKKLECSPVERDLRGLVDGKLNMS